MFKSNSHRDTNRKLNAGRVLSEEDKISKVHEAKDSQTSKINNLKLIIQKQNESIKKLQDRLATVPKNNQVYNRFPSQRERKWSFKLDRVDLEGQRSTQPMSPVILISVSDSPESNAAETIKSCQEDVQKIMDFLLSLNFPIILIVWPMIVFLLNEIKTELMFGLWLSFYWMKSRPSSN